MDTHVHIQCDSQDHSTLEQGRAHRGQAASQPETCLGGQNAAPIVTLRRLSHCSTSPSTANFVGAT